MADTPPLFILESSRYYPHERRLLARFGEKPKRSKHGPPRKMVHISAAHHQLLVTMTAIPRLNGVALGTLLDNILTVFFEDYATDIRDEVKWLENRFPSTDTPPG